MLRVSQILASRLALVASLAALTVLAAAGCGQRGPLFLPGDVSGTARATLPQTLRPEALFMPPPPPGMAAAEATLPPAPAVPLAPSALGPAASQPLLPAFVPSFAAPAPATP